MRRFECIVLLLASIISTNCTDKQTTPKTIWRTKQWVKVNKVHNHLSDVEQAQGWQLLFDGKTLNGWHLYQNPDATRFSAWNVDQGTLHCRATNPDKLHGDLITDHAYANYELYFEWRIAFRCNSGVFINVQENQGIAQTYQSGPEYQLLAPSHSDNQVPNKRPGCLWGFAPQKEMVEAKPAGSWNQSRILQNDGKIAFFLNGVQTAQEDLNSEAWAKSVAQSGFAEQPMFGKTTAGKIALQHWYFDVWFRNIKIREL
ncbi:MAG: DUF1080 domain-containing protein [Bacteroidota bacterium]